MKRTLIAILLISNVVNSYSQKYMDYESFVWEVIKPKNVNVTSDYDGLSFSNDTLNITIKPTGYFVNIRIRNLLESRIGIIWDESMIGSYNMSNIAFGDMRVIQVGASIPSSYLEKNESLYKEITGVYYANNKLPLIDYSSDKNLAKKNKMVWHNNVRLNLMVNYGVEKKVFKIELLGTYKKDFSKKERKLFNENNSFDL